MKTTILGISAFYHDSAACLMVDGEIIAAAQEERFTRIKHDASFPKSAIRYVLSEAGIEYNELTAIAFYDKPFLKFERLMENYHAFIPRGFLSFMSAVPIWVKEKLFMKRLLRRNMAEFGKISMPILFPEHHLSHAASAFYPSPFQEAAILTVDGVGEWATTAIFYGKAHQITILKQLDYPHSLGLLYSAFTYYLGFRVNSGEYKVMGLAPFGNADSAQTKNFTEKILEHLIDIREDGSLLLNMDYFDFSTSLRMTNNKKWNNLFGLPVREPESSINQAHMDLALALQQVTEKCMVSLAQLAQRLTGSRNLVMAGGVALNCVVNSKIAETGLFDNIWVQPAAGDAGGAVGAAYVAFHISENQPRHITFPDAMKSALLGPENSDREILRCIRQHDAVFNHFQDFNQLTGFISKKISEGKVVGWFQDRMEFGPRALGNRSIIGDPRNPQMQKIMNLKIKFREAFRPFAPAVLAEDLSEYFDSAVSSPYMLFVYKLRNKWVYPSLENEYESDMLERLYHERSAFPAITHMDYTSRVQTVNKHDHPKFWTLINAFKNITGCGMVINTSFNVRGEPIVCTPRDAFAGFMKTGMDFLVMGNYVFDKNNQNKQPLPNFRQLD
ncbi:MAG: carbamoyltransferase [Bacteroidota bacterium]|nr:carbamoyltransferase [Bacteroidota bacterium]